MTKVAATFRGLTLRQTARPAADDRREPSTQTSVTTPPGAAPATRTLRLVPCWSSEADEAEAESVEAVPTLVFAFSEGVGAWAERGLPNATIRVVPPTITTDALVDTLRGAVWAERVVCCLQNDADGPAHSRAAIQLFRIARALLLCGKGQEAIEFVTVTEAGVAVQTGEIAAPDPAGALGFIGCLAKELPNWRIKAADIARVDHIGLAQILGLPRDPEGNVVALREGRRLRQRFTDCALAPVHESAFRKGGVYVVIGGAGRLGEVLSAHLVRHYDAKVIWVGRSPLSDAVQTKIDRLARFGPAPEYLRADARDPAGVGGVQI